MAPLEGDRGLHDLRDYCDLEDLHQADPAPSTYIGAASRRIDFMLGCPRVASAVTRQGSLAYTEGPQSDHRGLYVDLDIERLLGAIPLNPMERSSTRLLNSGNPELVATYLEGMRKYYADHSMITRINTLAAEHSTMTQSQVRKLLTTWDNDQGRAMQTAEAQLHAPTRQYQWSPKLRNAGVVLRYWKLRLREYKFDEDYATTFDRWETGIQGYDSNVSSYQTKVFHLTIEEIRTRLNVASRTLKTDSKASHIPSSTEFSRSSHHIRRRRQPDDHQKSPKGESAIVKTNDTE